VKQKIQGRHKKLGFPLTELILLTPRLSVTPFRNKTRFYGEEFLAPRPKHSKLEDQPLSAVRDYLFDIFAARLRLKCDGTRAETRFRLSTKRMSTFKSAGASVQSTAGS